MGFTPQVTINDYDNNKENDDRNNGDSPNQQRVAQFLGEQNASRGDERDNQR
jgi:hypothetical protein